MGLSLREAELRHALRRQGNNAQADMHAIRGADESLSYVLAAAAEATPLSELCDKDDETTFLRTGWASIDEEALPGGVRRCASNIYAQIQKQHGDRFVCLHAHSSKAKPLHCLLSVSECDAHSLRVYTYVCVCRVMRAGVT